jgi:hypothetical protein
MNASPPGNAAGSAAAPEGLTGSVFLEQDAELAAATSIQA